MSRRVLACVAALTIAACGAVKSTGGDDAPAGRVCSVGSTTACSGDNLITCDADGNQVSSEVCALGCNAAGTSQCKLVNPSNGLAAALDNAKLAPDLVLMGVTTIDTDAGTITDQSGARTPPTTSVTGGPIDIFVIEAKTFTAPAQVLVTGTHALAIVSFGAVEIDKQLGVDASGFGIDGSGAIAGDPTCAGATPTTTNSAGESGGGGGGFGTKGGNGGSGGAPTIAGGTGGGAVGAIELVPLRGGCRGGRAGAQASNHNGGGGGGAIQIVSNTSITINDTGFVSANGGGGQGPNQMFACLVNTPCGDGEGGGSGGGILLEAPVVTVSALGGVTANGGGASCSVSFSASNGLLSAMAAPAQTCAGNTGSGGNGAAGSLGALNGVAGSGNNPVGGGGGGGAGRIRINLPLGTTFAPAGTISPAPSLGTLATR